MPSSKPIFLYSGVLNGHGGADVFDAVFLPLTFVTGLLGMNVGGLPGLESPRGFLVSVVVMVAAAAGLPAFFRAKKWL